MTKAKVQPIPEGYHTATPYLVIRDAGKAIEFYKKAFGAQELYRMPAPDGKIMHGEIQIGSSRIMLSDEFPEMGTRSPQALNGTPVSLFLYVEDVDKTFANALAAGAKQRAALQDMFWGDRFGKVTDPFGHEWQVATRKETVTPEEMEKRTKAAFAAK